MEKLISIKNLTAEQKYFEVCLGMIVEYSDPANDTDSGNYGEITNIYDETRYNFLTEEEFSVYFIALKLNQGQAVTIKASQVLAHSEWELDWGLDVDVAA